MDQYTRKAIDFELNRWGKWLEDNSYYEGHSRECILTAFLSGRSGISGHRILCLDMPSYIYATHGRVLRLPEAEQEAVHLYFAIRVKPDGTAWTIQERCVRSGITEGAMRQRLARARYRIAGLPVPRWKETKQALAAVSQMA